MELIKQHKGIPLDVLLAYPEISRLIAAYIESVLANNNHVQMKGGLVTHKRSFDADVKDRTLRFPDIPLYYANDVR